MVEEKAKCGIFRYQNLFFFLYNRKKPFRRNSATAKPTSKGQEATKSIAEDNTKYTKREKRDSPRGCRFGAAGRKAEPADGKRERQVLCPSSELSPPLTLGSIL